MTRPLPWPAEIEEAYRSLYDFTTEIDALARQCQVQGLDGPHNSEMLKSWLDIISGDATGIWIAVREAMGKRITDSKAKPRWVVNVLMEGLVASGKIVEASGRAQAAMGHSNYRMVGDAVKACRAQAQKIKGLLVEGTPPENGTDNE